MEWLDQPVLNIFEHWCLMRHYLTSTKGTDPVRQNVSKHSDDIFCRRCHAEGHSLIVLHLLHKLPMLLIIKVAFVFESWLVSCHKYSDAGLLICLMDFFHI